MDNILKRTLSDIFCDNMPLSEIRENVFRMDSDLRSCEDSIPIDLALFLEAEENRLKEMLEMEP